MVQDLCAPFAYPRAAFA
ncbi:hypothetical protein NO134_09205 [Ochrobactrum sp. BD22]|nr:hypothetical protein [Ochrobactrum sp. 3-3]